MKFTHLARWVQPFTEPRRTPRSSPTLALLVFAEGDPHQFHRVYAVGSGRGDDVLGLGWLALFPVAYGCGADAERFGDVFEHTPVIAERAHRAGLSAIDDTADGLHTTLMGVVRAMDRDEKLALIRAHPELAGREAVEGTMTGVLFVDLDDFKVTNDTMGHSVGDELLVAAGVRLAAVVRETDTAARLGGTRRRTAVWP